MEMKSVPGMYATGEVLDIDGVTGGFNFQAAWSTAAAVAKAIAN
jgi:predicted flavoprotein YhiN